MTEAVTLSTIEKAAAAADGQCAWPAKSWKLVKEIGALEWAIPTEFGGAGASAAQLLSAYEKLAGACMTSCFILTQRDAACRRILGSANPSLRQELLPPLARGDSFATVGLSQLTTSRQHVGPTFTVRQREDEFVFDGVIPWVTGACRAAHVVIGGAMADRRQILCVLPTDSKGVSVGEPLKLMALQGSLTAEIRCDHVRVHRRWLLAGPQEKVMHGKPGGAGGLQTSCLALGLAGAAVTYLQKEAENRPALASGANRLAATHAELLAEMYRLVDGPAEPAAITRLRARANTLVVQAAQAALIAGKGAGFVRGHPAERWVRQAMFFLVWSCPWPAASATLDFLTFSSGEECVSE